MDSFGRLSEIDDGQWPLVWQYDKCGRITQEHQGFIGVIKAPKTRTNGLRQAKQNSTGYTNYYEKNIFIKNNIK